MWNSLILGALLRGEKALSWQSPGGALTAFELGNAPLFGAFQGSRADAKQMRGKKEFPLPQKSHGGFFGKIKERGAF